MTTNIKKAKLRLRSFYTKEEISKVSTYYFDVKITKKGSRITQRFPLDIGLKLPANTLKELVKNPEKTKALFKKLESDPKLLKNLNKAVDKLKTTIEKSLEQIEKSLN